MFPSGRISAFRTTVGSNPSGTKNFALDIVSKPSTNTWYAVWRLFSFDIIMEPIILRLPKPLIRVYRFESQRSQTFCVRNHFQIGYEHPVTLSFSFNSIKSWKVFYVSKPLTHVFESQQYQNLCVGLWLQTVYEPSQHRSIVISRHSNDRNHWFTYPMTNISK